MIELGSFLQGSSLTQSRHFQGYTSIQDVQAVTMDGKELYAVSVHVLLHESCHSGYKIWKFLPNDLLQCVPLLHCFGPPFHTLYICQLFGCDFGTCCRSFPSLTSPFPQVGVHLQNSEVQLLHCIQLAHFYSQEVSFLKVLFEIFASSFKEA